MIAFNGGFVNYQDLEDNNRIGRYDIDGQSTSVSFELGFDDQSPRHCYMYEAVASCNDAPLVTPDFVDQVRLKLLNPFPALLDSVGNCNAHKLERCKNKYRFLYNYLILYSPSCL